MTTLYQYLGPSKNPHPELRISYGDALWIGRAFIGEHGGIRTDPEELRAFVWCMINRFLLHPANRHWHSFRYMLRRFSQPVNPRWQRDGDLAEKHPNSPMCTEARFKRREYICGLDWSDFDSSLQKQLDSVLDGALPRPTVPQWEEGGYHRWSNFAAVSKGLKRRHPHGTDVGGNWYFEDQRLRKGSVVIDHWR